MGSNGTAHLRHTCPKVHTIERDEVCARTGASLESRWGEHLVVQNYIEQRAVNL